MVIKILRDLLRTITNDSDNLFTLHTLHYTKEYEQITICYVLLKRNLFKTFLQ